MTRACDLYEACDRLFKSYRLAVTSVNRLGSVRSMVLMDQDEGAGKFFILSRDASGYRPFYSVCSWQGGEVVDIDADTIGAVSSVIVSALTHGVPIPQHGSLWGSADSNFISALIAVYADHTPARLEPSWALMPFTDIPEVEWPSFAQERTLGHWFWEDYRSGKIIWLASLIAKVPHAVFWIDTNAILGSECCAVAREIRSPRGPILRRGRYVHYGALKAGKPVPSLSDLLTDKSKIDLAPRFQFPEYSESDLLSCG